MNEDNRRQLWKIIVEAGHYLGGFDGGESNIYRENDGVSFVRQVETQRRIKIILNSFENVTINRYEDKL